MIIEMEKLMGLILPLKIENYEIIDQYKYVDL